MGRWIFCVAAVLLVPNLFGLDAIGINFATDRGGRLAPDDEAGATGLQQSNWNNFLLTGKRGEQTGRLPTLVDASGQTRNVTVQLAVHEISSGKGLSAEASGDEKLMSHGVRVWRQQAFGEYFVHVAGIPYERYDVVVYFTQNIDVDVDAASFDRKPSTASLRGMPYEQGIGYVLGRHSLAGNYYVLRGLAGELRLPFYTQSLTGMQIVRSEAEVAPPQTTRVPPVKIIAGEKRQREAADALLVWDATTETDTLRARFVHPALRDGLNLLTRTNCAMLNRGFFGVNYPSGIGERMVSPTRVDGAYASFRFAPDPGVTVQVNGLDLLFVRSDARAPTIYEAALFKNGKQVLSKQWTFTEPLPFDHRGPGFPHAWTFPAQTLAAEDEAELRLYFYGEGQVMHSYAGLKGEDAIVVRGTVDTGKAAKPAVPGGLRATTVNGTELQLTWPRVAGADHFVIERAREQDAFSEITVSQGDRLTDAGLDYDTDYHYRLIAVSPAGLRSAASSLASVRTGKGPVAWYRFDQPEGAGSAVPDSVGRFPARGFGKAYRRPEIGMDHGAIFLYGDQSPGYIDAGSDVANTDSLSVALWFKARDVKDQVLVDKMPESGGKGFSLRAYADGSIGFLLGSVDNHHEMRSTARYTTQMWVHVTGTFGGGNMRLSIDGIADGEKTVKQRARTAAVPMQIGGVEAGRAVAGFQAQRTSYGLIDDVRIYDYVVDAGHLRAFVRYSPTRNAGGSALNAAGSDAGAEEVLEFTDDAIRRLMPKQFYITIRDITCPKCKKKNYHSRWGWEPSKPEQLLCSNCNTAFPSADFAANKEQVVKNQLSEPVHVRWYEETDVHFNHEMITGALRFEWLCRALTVVAQKYANSGDRRYAKRAALILHLFSEQYPRSVMKMRAGPDAFRDAHNPADPPANPYGWYERIWSTVRYCAETTPRRGEFIKSYDLIRSSGVLEELQAETGKDLRWEIETHLFRRLADYVMGYSWPHAHYINNLNRYYFGPLGTLYGPVLERPEYTHMLYQLSLGTLTEFGREHNFNYPVEMNWGGEGPAYGMMIGSIVEDNVPFFRRYSDPPDYVNPVDRTRLSYVDLETQVPELSKAIKSLKHTGLFPTGRKVPLHDSSHYMSEKQLADAWKTGTLVRKERTECELLSGYGLALLGAGTGDQQIQSIMSFSIGAGHNHRCRMQLLLFAHGQELLSDLGYLRGPLRSWSAGTLGHNTVVIDRHDQNLGLTNGSVQYYAEWPGLSVIQVDGRNAYNSTADPRSRDEFRADAYQRTLAMNTVDIDAPYVIDVFRVAGGSTHDYSLHGSADHDQIGSSTLSLAPCSDAYPLLENGESFDKANPTAHANYGLFVDAATAPGDKPFSITLTDPESAVGTRHHFIGHPNLQVYLGKTPQLRKLKNVEDIDTLLALKMPHLILRHRGKEGLKTTFVAVHEPFKGATKIQEVAGEVLADGVLLTIRFRSGRVDQAFVALHGSQDFTGELLQGSGHFALVSKRNESRRAFLLGGDALAAPDGSWSLDVRSPTYSGTLLPVSTRKFAGDATDALVSDSPLPTGQTLHGRYLIVRHGRHYTGVPATHAYPIDQVEKRGQEYWVHLLEDHGLRVDGSVTTELYAPNREFYGNNTFTILSQTEQTR